MRDQRRFYKTIFFITSGGYAWLMISILAKDIHSTFLPECLFKSFLGIPCPSCGVTRGVLLLIRGSFLEAIVLNPLSIIVALIMISVPVFLIHDLFRSQLNLYNMYHTIERKLSNRKLAIILSCLVAVNWIWNVHKGL